MGVCDFISAMDTARVPEWNCWYHIMNCGFPLKASGETDFPCISGSRVGQGRVYVQLGKVDKVDFARLVRGARQGPVVRLRRLRPRPGVHASTASRPAAKWSCKRPGTVKVKAKVAFAVGHAARARPTGGQVPTGDDAARSS